MGTNVFADAGYKADDATVMAIRSDLATQIAEFLERRQLQQVPAARLLEVPQPTISKIVNGRIDNLSIELLIRMLVRANVPVVIQTGSTVKDAGAYLAAGKELANTATAAPSEPVPSMPPHFLVHLFVDGDSPRDAEAAAARAFRAQPPLSGVATQ